jgi:V8-like Glu-specific endopeptidase
VIGADTRDQITGTTGYPWRCIGLIRVKWDNGKWYQGTGAMIGPQQMLTCGHNLHDKDEAGATDKWAVEFEFYPGQTSLTRPKAGGGVEPNPNARPYGKVGWKTVYWWRAWLTSKDRDYDMMMVVLDKPIGNTVGWFGRETGGTDVNKWRQLSGYPGDKPQYEQWWAGGTVSSETTHQIRYDNDTIAGHSGSPVWYYNATADQRYIRGVHIGDRTATAANPNRGVSMNRGKFETLSSWVAEPVAKAGTACEDCGLDCNGNGVGDSLDIAHGTSLDSNHDDIPDECQPDIVLPPDQIVCVGPSPGSVPVGATATITVHVSRASVALAGRWVSFRSPTGNVKFLDGFLGPGGTTSLMASDGGGMVTMHFQPTAPGPGVIRAESPEGTPYSECTFNGTPVPVLVEDLRATAGADGVRLAWRLGASLRQELRAIDVERSTDGSNGPYVQRTVLAPASEMEFVDAEATRGRTYHYRLVLEWTGGSTSIAGPIRVDVSDALRLRTSLQVPVDRGAGGIEIRYTLGQSNAAVSLDLYDVAGRHVRALERGVKAPGSYVRLWDRRDDTGAQLARGVYIVRLQDGNAQSLTRKLALLRN